MRDYEASLLRLLDKLTNGMKVEINETGTTLKYKPGIVTGGRRISHDCGTARAIGYFLEVVIPVCLFAKLGFNIVHRVFMRHKAIRFARVEPICVLVRFLYLFLDLFVVN